MSEGLSEKHPEQKYLVVPFSISSFSSAPILTQTKCSCSPHFPHLPTAALLLTLTFPLYWQFLETHLELFPVVLELFPNACFLRDVAPLSLRAVAPSDDGLICSKFIPSISKELVLFAVFLLPFSFSSFFI